MALDLLTLCAEFTGNPKARYHSVAAPITPAEATIVIENYNYVNQRPFSKKHVDILAIAMENKQFREFTPVDFAVLDGKPHLINGQHTLRALVKSKIPLNLAINLHKTDDLATVESLYGKYDIGRTRSLRDTFGSLGAEMALAPRELTAVGVAVSLIMRGFKPIGGADTAIKQYERKNFDNIKAVMKTWEEEAKAYFACMAPASNFNKLLFMRGSVIAIGLLTFRHNKEKATEFWSAAVLDDGLRNEDPRRALISWLRNNGVMSKYGQVQYKAAAICWNAFFRGKQLTRVHANADGPLQVLGTPVELPG